MREVRQTKIMSHALPYVRKKVDLREVYIRTVVTIAWDVWEREMGAAA